MSGGGDYADLFFCCLQFCIDWWRSPSFFPRQDDEASEDESRD